MLPQNSLHSTATAILLLSTFTAAATTSQELKFLIDGTPYTPAHKASLTISPDLTLQFTISTNSSSSLAALSSDQEQTSIQTDFFATAQFHNSGPISEIWVGDWDVETGLELDEGVTATINAAAYMDLTYKVRRKPISA